MPRQSLDGVRLHIILTKPQHKRLEAVSKASGLGVSELVRRAVDFYIANASPKAKK